MAATNSVCDVYMHNFARGVNFFKENFCNNFFFAGTFFGDVGKKKHNKIFEPATI